MKTKSTTIVSSEPAQEVTTFDQELARITKECAHLTAQIGQNQAELVTMAERARNRQSQEEATQTQVDAARETYNAGQLRAELLTSGEMAKAAQKELSKLEGQLRTAQDSQLKLLSRLQQEANAEDRKRIHLEETIARDTETIQRLEERKHIAGGLREKALFEKAEALLCAHLDTVKAMQATRDQQHSILASMDVEIEAYIHRATQELASFPEQQAAFSAQSIYNDALTGILQGQIDFIGLVLATGRAAGELPIEVARKTNTYWQGLAGLLALDAAHFRPALSKQILARPDILLERRELLTKLLEVYREEKAEVKA